MRLLFVHQNFPGQYRNLLLHLAATRKHEIVFLTQREDASIDGVTKVVYKPARKITEKIHRYLRTTEAGVLNAQAVFRVAAELKKKGFRPDLMIGHNAWGETLFLKDVFPDVPLLGYFEFFYRPTGSDIDFDPEYPDTIDTRLRARLLNTLNLVGLQVADWGQSPTQWQRDQFPEHYRQHIAVLHEGIDTGIVKPDAKAVFKLPSGEDVRVGDEVVTYISRSLEPYRGFHIFMRALPEILRRRPKARAIIVGGDDVSYGSPLPQGQTFRAKALAELGDSVDPSRVYFLGRIPYNRFVNLLQVSAAHVYLTYPFVLSWSMLEAMSAGCVVIGSSTPPVKEFIRDGENGLLVDFFSHQEIADTVERVLVKPDKFKLLRTQARRTVVEGYDFRSICLPQQLKLIEALAGGKLVAEKKSARPKPQKRTSERKKSRS